MEKVDSKFHSRPNNKTLTQKDEKHCVEILYIYFNKS